VHLRNRTIRAHFHPVDQFQILIGAPGGRYQGHDLPDFTVHYADAYSTYGPLVGEDPPMRFFTLRTEPSAFQATMPDDRSKLAWRGRRNRHVEFERLATTEIPAAGAVEFAPIWERDDDGLEALAIAAGPDTKITLPDTHGTNGQFVFVADGWVEVNGKKCDVESLGWQDASEPSAELTAGSTGARVFVMKFPSPSTVVQHDETAKAASVS